MLLLQGKKNSGHCIWRKKIKSRTKLGCRYIAKDKRIFWSQCDYLKDFPKLIISKTANTLIPKQLGGGKKSLVTEENIII